MKRWSVWIWIVLLYLLRFDFWNWHSPTLLFDLPVGLAYHVSYCLVVAVVLAVFVSRVWPPDHTADRPEPGSR